MPLKQFDPDVLCSIEAHAKKYIGYDQESGIIFWKCRRQGSHLKAGERAGRVGSTGYREITFLLSGKRVTVKEHRLAWFLHYGAWPVGVIDHIDHIKTNNKINNMRDITNQENIRNSSIALNNTSGYTGVTWNKAAKKWQAQYMKGKKMQYIGVFLSIEEARDAVVAARLKSGFHENHGGIR